MVTTRAQGLRLGATQLAERLDAPFLGGIPRLRGAAARSQRLLGSTQHQEGFAGTIAGIVLELEKEVRSGNIRSLMVTSGRSGEGKTTIASGLSKAMASLGLEVLLVDLDLRRPRAGGDVYRVGIPRSGSGDDSFWVIPSAERQSRFGFGRAYFYALPDGYRSAGDASVGSFERNAAGRQAIVRRPADRYATAAFGAGCNRRRQVRRRCPPGHRVWTHRYQRTRGIVPASGADRTTDPWGHRHQSWI
jgi:hypothetical protein